MPPLRYCSPLRQAGDGEYLPVPYVICIPWQWRVAHTHPRTHAGGGVLGLSLVSVLTALLFSYARAAWLGVLCLPSIWETNYPHLRELLLQNWPTTHDSKSGYAGVWVASETRRSRERGANRYPYNAG